MSKMSELDLVLQEFHAAAKALIGAADSLRDFFGNTAEPATADAPPESEAKPEPPKPEPLKLEEVRAVLAEKSRNGHTAKIRELLEKYGAAKLSDIDPANYAALLAEAEVLGNGK